MLLCIEALAVIVETILLIILALRRLLGCCLKCVASATLNIK